MMKLRGLKVEQKLQCNFACGLVTQLHRIRLQDGDICSPFDIFQPHRGPYTIEKYDQANITFKSLLELKFR